MVTRSAERSGSDSWFTSPSRTCAFRKRARSRLARAIASISRLASIPIDCVGQRRKHLEYPSCPGAEIDKRCDLAFADKLAPGHLHFILAHVKRPDSMPVAGIGPEISLGLIRPRLSHRVELIRISFELWRILRQ